MACLYLTISCFPRVTMIHKIWYFVFYAIQFLRSGNQMLKRKVKFNLIKIKLNPILEKWGESLKCHWKSLFSTQLVSVLLLAYIAWPPPLIHSHLRILLFRSPAVGTWRLWPSRNWWKVMPTPWQPWRRWVRARMFLNSKYLHAGDLGMLFSVDWRATVSL